jgi:hypothetical protein
MATFEEARQIKNRHSAELLRQPGVSGVGVERDAEGNYFIAIHLDAMDPAVESTLPAQLEGCPTKLLRSGPFLKLS